MKCRLLADANQVNGSKFVIDKTRRRHGRPFKYLLVNDPAGIHHGFIMSDPHVNKANLCYRRFNSELFEAVHLPRLASNTRFSFPLSQLFAVSFSASLLLVSYQSFAQRSHAPNLMPRQAHRLGPPHLPGSIVGLQSALQVYAPHASSPNKPTVLEISYLNDSLCIFAPSKQFSIPPGVSPYV